MGWWLEYMILVFFSKLNDSIILPSSLTQDLSDWISVISSQGTVELCFLVNLDRFVAWIAAHWICWGNLSCLFIFFYSHRGLGQSSGYTGTQGKSYPGFVHSLLQSWLFSTRAAQGPEKIAVGLKCQKPSSDNFSFWKVHTYSKPWQFPLCVLSYISRPGKKGTCRVKDLLAVWLRLCPTVDISVLEVRWDLIVIPH